MQRVSLLFLFLLPLWLLAQGELILSLNGKSLSADQFRSAVLCGDGQDSLQVSFRPSTAPPAGTRYVIPQIELWGQVQLGQPMRLGSLNPADFPDGFEIRDLLGAGGLPPSRDALRVSLRVGRVLLLKKGLVQQQLPLKGEGYLRFLLVSACQ